MQICCHAGDNSRHFVPRRLSELVDAWGRLADEQDTQIWELLAHQRCYSVHQPLSGICIRGVGQNALKENSRMFLPAAPVDSFADFRGDAVRWSVGVGNDHRVGESGTLKISG